MDTVVPIGDTRDTEKEYDESTNLIYELLKHAPKSFAYRPWLFLLAGLSIDRYFYIHRSGNKYWGLMTESRLIQYMHIPSIVPLALCITFPRKVFSVGWDYSDNFHESGCRLHIKLVYCVKSPWDLLPFIFVQSIHTIALSAEWCATRALCCEWVASCDQGPS